MDRSFKRLERRQSPVAPKYAMGLKGMLSEIRLSERSISRELISLRLRVSGHYLLRALPYLAALILAVLLVWAIAMHGPKAVDVLQKILAQQDAELAPETEGAGTFNSAAPEPTTEAITPASTSNIPPLQPSPAATPGTFKTTPFTSLESRNSTSTPASSERDTP